MRKLIIVLVFICSLIAVTALHAQQGKGAALLNETKPATGQVHGLIIGINQYQDFPALQYANADALNFYRLLLSPSIGADSSHVVLLLNEKASSPNVYEALENLVTFAKPGDRVFIYFSGHGDVEKTTVQQFGFLVTYDTPKKMVMRNSLDVNHLNAYVNTLSLKNKADVFLITDACRSGRINESQNIDYSYLAQTLGGKTADEVRILSSQSNQLSYEGAQWGQGRGLFSYVLTNGIAGNADADGDSIVTLYELSLYLMQEVPKMAKPNKQTPIVMGPLDMPVSTRSNFTNTKGSEVLVAMADLGGKGYEDLYLDSLSITQRNDYDSLLACIAANKLQKPSGRSARDYYEKLRASSLPEPFSLLITRKLIAALQKQGQEVLHKLIVLNVVPERGYKLDASIAANMKYSADLLGKDHYLYQSTMAKYYYFLSFSYYLKDPYQDDPKLLQIALETIDKALAIDSNVAEFYITKGHYLSALELHDQALQFLQKAQKLAPTNPTITCVIGLNYAALGNNKNARNSFERTLALDSSYAFAYNSLAILCRAEEKYEEGLKWINKALAIDSLSSFNWQIKGHLLCLNNSCNEGMACFYKANKLKPQDRDIYQDIAYALTNYAKDYQRALLYEDSALAITPNDEYLLQEKAAILYYLQECSRGQAVIQQALRADRQSDKKLSYVVSGSLYMCQGLYQEAINAFDSATFYDAAHKLYKDELKLLGILNKNEEGLAYANKYLQQNPTDVEAYTFKGGLLARLKRYDEALAAYKKSDSIKETAFNSYNIACLYSLQNAVGDAISMLEKAFKLGWTDFEWIDKDTDWDNIRETPEFKALIKKYRK